MHGSSRWCCLGGFLLARGCGSNAERPVVATNGGVGQDEAVLEAVFLYELREVEPSEDVVWDGRDRARVHGGGVHRGGSFHIVELEYTLERAGRWRVTSDRVVQQTCSAPQLELPDDAAAALDANLAYASGAPRGARVWTRVTW